MAIGDEQDVQSLQKALTQWGALGTELDRAETEFKYPNIDPGATVRAGAQGVDSAKLVDGLARALSLDDGPMLRVIRCDTHLRSKAATFLVRHDALSNVHGGPQGPIGQLLLQPLGSINGDFLDGFRKDDVSKWVPEPSFLNLMGSPLSSVRAAHEQWRNLITAEYGPRASWTTAGEAGRFFANRFHADADNSVLAAVVDDEAIRDEWAWVVGGRPWLQECVRRASPEVLAWLEESPHFDAHLNPAYAPGTTAGMSIEEVDQVGKRLRTEDPEILRPANSGMGEGPFYGARSGKTTHWLGGQGGGLSL